MKTSRFLPAESLVAGLFLVGLASTAALAQTSAKDPVPYALSPESSFDVGCFDGCACPVLSMPMRGTFLLRFVSDNSLFRTYAVENVDWVFGSPQSEKRITGSGTYRLGGEVAVQQELILDLDVAGRRQHFESGLVGTTNDLFPRIQIEAAANGFACFDTVLSIRARPIENVGFEGEKAHLLALRSDPNPFQNATRVFFVLRDAAVVDARIHDSRGREIRALAAGTPYDRGGHTLVWDGRDGNGRHCTAGVYYLRVTIEGKGSSLRIVKLRGTYPER